MFGNRAYHTSRIVLVGTIEQLPVSESVAEPFERTDIRPRLRVGTRAIPSMFPLLHPLRS